MAQTDAIINVKVVGQQSINALDNAITRLQKRFGSLQSAVAGIGLLAFTRNAFQAADAMSDLSNSTGVAVSTIIELQYATEAAGGRLDQVNQSVLKFSLSIDEAAQGSIKLQDAFAELGVSLEELGTLSQDQLLQEVAKGFLEIKDKGRQAALANELFGKSIRGVDIEEYSRQLLQNRGRYDEYAQSVEKAAKLQGELDRALIDLRIAFLNVISPFVTFINNMKASEGGIERFTELIRILTIAISALAAGAGFIAILRVFGMLARGTAIFVRMLAGAESRIGKFATAVKKAYEPNSDTMKAARALGALGAGAATAGFVANMTGGGGAFRGKGATGSWGTPEKTNEQAAAERAVYDERQKQIAQIQAIGAAYAQQQNDYIRSITRQREALDLSEQEIVAREAYNEVIDNAEAEVRKLQERIKELGKDEQYLKGTLQEQINVINGRKEADAQAAASEARNLQNRIVLNEELIKDIEMLNSILANDQNLVALQRQAELIGLTGDALAEKQLLLENQEELENRLLDIQQRRNQLAADAEKLGKDRVAAEIDRLNEEERIAKEYANRKYQIEKDLAEKTKALRDSQTAGVKQALEDLARSVDPFKVAAESITSVFSNVDTAIKQLVTTGKFNFKDFALSIIADLLAIQTRAIIVRAILSAIGAIFGGGPSASVSSSVSPIPGVGFAAKGANTLAGQPFIVGEQGPELFVPKTAGSIVPNDKMGGQVNAPVTNVVNNYNISAVDAKSVAQLFAENRKSLLGAVGMAQKEMPYMMAG